MAKLMDIKGYWDMSYGNNFNDRDMWEGQILLEDDGWFEGIVVDPNSSNNEDRFIFGVYHPTKKIELFKFTPHFVLTPLVFHCKRDAKGYDGQFEVCKVPCGNSHIITQDAGMVRENVCEEIKSLESRIQKYKSTIMDKDCKDFYNNKLTMRKNMIQDILRDYEGEKLNKEQADQDIDKASQDEDNAIKLTKQIFKDLAEDEDDDFPL